MRRGPLEIDDQISPPGQCAVASLSRLVARLVGITGSFAIFPRSEPLPSGFVPFQAQLVHEATAAIELGCVVHLGGRFSCHLDSAQYYSFVIFVRLSERSNQFIHMRDEIQLLVER